ncbi:YidB family protein [Leminorella grimontii]|uniref:YidB family protein n=1 Tax=Leminorella grimontii TaxID=82981 RepID=UPI0032208BB9
MSLLDQLGGMLGGNGASKGGVDYMAILQWLEQQGGLSGLLETFRQGGLAELVQSWIGTGANLPISADQVRDVISQAAMEQLSAKLGMDNGHASAIIAQYLPDIVDKLSPKGEEPVNPDMLSLGMALLKGKLFG